MYVTFRPQATPLTADTKSPFPHLQRILAQLIITLRCLLAVLHHQRHRLGQVTAKPAGTQAAAGTQRFAQLDRHAAFDPHCIIRGTASVRWRPNLQGKGCRRARGHKVCTAGQLRGLQCQRLTPCFQVLSCRCVCPANRGHAMHCYVTHTAPCKASSQPCTLHNHMFAPATRTCSPLPC